MTECIILTSILKYNKNYIDNILKNSLFDNVLCRYISLEIIINYFYLCDYNPQLINFLIKDLNFNDLIIDYIELYIENYLSKLNYENIGIIKKRSLYQITLNHICPVSLFRKNMKDLYQFSKNLNIVSRKDLENTLVSLNIDSSGLQNLKYRQVTVNNTNLISLCGRVYKIKEEHCLKSCFMVCKNKLCIDKTYVLMLFDVNYLITESKKTFTHVVSDRQKTCLNCKGYLEENIEYRTYMIEYKYILSASNFYVYIKTKLSLNENGCYFGTFERNNNGKLLFNVTKEYVIQTDCIHYMMTDVCKINIELQLLSITSAIFKRIKANCDLQDTILFIILNILSIHNTRILIFTSDPQYVKNFAVHLMKIKNLQKNIYYDMKSFKDKNGLCIRDYNDTKIFKIDLIFHMPISNLVDYSYSSCTDDFSVISKSKNLTEDDHRNIQELFIKFRKEFKRIIEPERLLNMLAHVYSSIHEYQDDASQINDFILKHFVDKLL
ncbi:hypothetical protein AAJ76_1600067474 [Vairimorpha ceranae]|uniref:Uncharacterized protein n=1 Tax=Vairimorpha ceranae TaxID=40302 RepID=A0A0F9WDZ1_9MICR|nr:hypothetical protein AAJ76_1600067474 [Vairimorpha ceranae]KAF5141141.1 hypothetical protein G9O61_00g004570 [Vairimorpha ceranae]KKO75631.1 hypothetical protein AAJ76_1600067474 [Vairimorpha ceranae]